MKNKKIIVLIMILVALFTINCKKDNNEDSSTNALLLYLVDQTSGNCATITKSTTTTGLYSVGLSPLPKGGCSISATREASITATKSLYSKLIEVYTKAGSSCDTIKTTISTLSSNTTVSTTYSNTTEEQYATSIANSRASTVASLVTESAATLTALGYTVASTKAATSDQYFIYLASAFSSGTCLTAVQSLDSALFTGITAKTIAVSSSCSYGTASSVTSTNRCATLTDAF